MKKFQIVLRTLALVLLMLAAVPLTAIEKKNYKIFIILDTIDIWSTGIRDGIKLEMDKQLKAAGASATYKEFDTKVDPAEVPAIIKAIEKEKPDLILMAVYPDGFADVQIAKKLTSNVYRFVSADPIPEQIGLIKSWANPGGNVTGVGVFVQMSSQLKIAKTLNPKINKVVFYSWDVMTDVNNWFESELKAATKQEKMTLEFQRVKSLDEEFELFKKIDSVKNNNTLVLGGVSAFVDAKGNSVDANTLEPKFIRENIKHTFFINYDESSISQGGGPAGATVIWSDIGVQMAEKGIKILNGANPGSIPWSYPRKYNLCINLQSAKNIGLEFPQSFINTAYRVYIDYKGNFKGKQN